MIVGFLLLVAGIGLTSVPSDTAIAPTAEFTEITTASGFLPFRNRWSPTDAIVVFNGRLPGEEGLHAIDVEQPDRGPWRLTDQYCGYVNWAPDGRWILCQYGHGRETLIAVPIEGGNPVGIASGDLGHFAWCGDGVIYYFDREFGVQTATPPDVWLSSWASAAMWTPQLIPIPCVELQYGNPPCRDRASPFPHVIRPNEAGETTIEPLLPSLTHLRTMVQSDLPGMKRALVVTTGDGPVPSYMLVSYEGEILQRYEVGVAPASQELARSLERGSSPDRGELLEWGSAPSAISADGRYLLRCTEIEDGNRSYLSYMELSDIGGEWIIRVANAPNGCGAALSRKGLFAICGSHDDDLLHIGRIDITWP
jgi:hypothetical protein